MRQLYFGDNLAVLRESIRDESVDLVYLDPPFNSNAGYNLLFRSPKGEQSNAQIEAFDDTWHWGETSEREFAEILHSGHTQVAEMMQAMRRFLGENDMMAYLTMMANRLIELRRVLKPTGSLYLHCDPSASHYLKVVLDGVFGHESFRNEIAWKRTHAHGSARRYGPIHDTLFFYSKSDRFTWTNPRQAHADRYLTKHFKIADKDGRAFQPIALTGAGVRSGDSGKPWRGIDPTKVQRHWALPSKLLARLGLSGSTQERLDGLDAAGWIYWPQKGGGVPRLKQYADELDGAAIPDFWDDIPPLSANAVERLGYPTQKPLALLERIISASSNEGDVVLDPFCGCGTAVHAAEKLRRNWIGIDITHLAIALIERRVKDAFPGIAYEVHGTPRDLDGARDLAARDKYQFQWWACALVGAQPWQGKKKGADSGIDGVLYFQETKGAAGKIVVSVKGGENVSVAMVRDLSHVVEREKAAIGLFVTLAPATRPMAKEAVAAGYYTSPLTGKAFPKVQILLIGGLLEGTEMPQYPDPGNQGLTFKKATTEVRHEQGSLL